MNRVRAVAVLGLSIVGTVPVARPQARSPITLPALALAARLGVRGSVAVGDRDTGQQRPWSIWLTRHFRPGVVDAHGILREYAPPSGRGLSVGPRGARGEFHYYDFSALRPGGVDPYRGRVVSEGTALRAALQWLRRSRTPRPNGAMHMIRRPGATYIGGSGLCCFKMLTIIYWGGRSDRWGGAIIGASGVLYVADAGSVVQADITPSPRSRPAFSSPCPGRTSRDSHGVALGSWCFNYPAAANAMLVADLGNHDPSVVQPTHGGRSIAFGSGISQSGWGSARVKSFTTSRLVYDAIYRGTTYRAEVVPAFPGFAGSIWELVSVRRASAA